MDRRKFLSVLTTGIGAIIAGVMTVPVVLHSLAPVFHKREEEEWRPLGPTSAFPLEKIVVARLKISKSAGRLNTKSVFVWRQEDQKFVVYSRDCTDLGCPLNFDSGSEWFYCPCHGGIFDKNGERRAGPPSKAMWRFKNRVHGDILEVDIRSVPPMV